MGSSKKCIIEFTEFANDDLSKLSDSLRQECWDMLQKLENNIHLGKGLLDNGIRDLSDCFKLYFHNGEYRIIYLKKNGCYEIQGITATRNVAEIVGIGPREGYQVYDDVAKRLKRFL